MSVIDPWYVENLVCPITKKKLLLEGNYLVTDGGQRYPIVEGLPIMLVGSENQTIGIAEKSISRSTGQLGDTRHSKMFLETLGISEQEKDFLVANIEKFQIDPVVSMLIGATSGYAYKDLIGDTTLRSYPIPCINLDEATGKELLDIGCNWGRWSIAAANKGFNVVGIDPSLGAVSAARRISSKMGLNIHFVVGDGRFLPFMPDRFNCVYSYSVVQHLSKEHASLVIKESARVTAPSGLIKIQMANKYGLRSFQHQLKRGFKAPANFDVRYWTPAALKKMFLVDQVASVKLTPECYLGLGWLESDRKYLTTRNKAILSISNFLKKLSFFLLPLRSFADSMFVICTKKPSYPEGGK